MPVVAAFAWLAMLLPIRLWMRFALMIGLIALLAGCATTQPSATVPIDLPALPSSLAAPCARPARLPTTAINAQDTERYWAADRTSLAKCADRHAATVSTYDDLRTRLAGAKR